LKLNDRFGITVAPSLYTSWTELTSPQPSPQERESSIPGLLNFHTWKIRDNYNFSLGAGISVGVSFYSK